MTGDPAMRPWHLVLIVLIAALSFAGSFECHAHSGDSSATKGG